MTIAIVVYKDNIVKVINPVVEWAKISPAGFLFPIALIAIIFIPHIVSFHIDFSHNNATLTSC